MRAPRSTYRWQLTADFPLAVAADRVDYLRELGADWVYCSPLLQAEHGSDHGYDVVDHSRTDASRGGRAGLERLATTAHAAELGLLIDIVPNHVGIATPELSLWWWDVLSHGRSSAHAEAFDIDWDAGGGRVRIPILGDGPLCDDGRHDPDAELDALRIESGLLYYYDHAFPIADGTADGSPRAVHDQQHYELIHFRRADTDLNYRRFFAVNSLAGIRVEVPAVFDASHEEIRHWLDAGWADGLRVDHPDGVADPAGYLERLAEISGGRYTVVEKILEPGEDLATDWACAGTTGYDTMALIDRVLVDPAGQAALDALDEALRGVRCDWAELIHDTKRAVADTILNSEIRRLARVFVDGAESRTASGTSSTRELPSAERLWDALAELVANVAVYRTYLPTGGAELTAALDRARSHRPDLVEVLDLIARAAAAAGTEFATRIEQTSGAVMAKGVEDCAFYRYPRLTSLTEVGGDPSVFAVPPADFHAHQTRRAAAWPHGMTSLTTHDTKRGEDVRARIDVLSEVADEWADSVHGWISALDFPDPVMAHLMFQAAVGTWPIERDRLHAYAEKASREAGDSTGWIDPDEQFETRLHELVDACYDHPDLAPQVAAWADRLRAPGWSNSLSAKLIQLTLPGSPDVYRGTELWENSLVDPDNRRPFDPLVAGGAADLLRRLDDGWLPPVDASGAAKLLVTSRALRARRDRSDAFTDYRPLAATGPVADHLLGFDRGGAITLATRLPVGLATRGGWGDTTVVVPDGRWVDVLTGRTVEGEAGPTGSVIAVGAVLDRYPVALLLLER